MARSNQSWFEYNGISSITYGVRLVDHRNSPLSGARGKQQTAAGRDGYIWQSDDARDSFEIKQKCIAPRSNKAQIKAWLQDAAMLRFWDESTLQYSARIAKQIDFKVIGSGTDPFCSFEVAFLCQPFPYIYPAASDIVLTSSGTTITNAGTAYSLPRVTIVGSGDFSVTIGGETVFFEGVPSGGIVVDSELMDAIAPNGASLLNDCMDGEPWRIQSGNNIVSWTGNVSRVTITPRWRCY